MFAFFVLSAVLAAHGDVLLGKKPNSCEGFCCAGRDSSCFAQKANLNSIIEDLEDIPCYCDHACLSLGDCCADYKSECEVQDCEVSRWETWTPCSKDCGFGAMTRTRFVTAEPKNGGKPCPILTQKRACRGTKCEFPTSRFTLEETAIILPIEYSVKRKLNASLDITRNLRLRYPKNPAKEKSKPYCVEYEIIHASRSCNMRQGSRVCTICEREAQRAHLDYKCTGTGTDGHSTRFTSLRDPTCRGKWKQMKMDFVCLCQAGAQYIFV